MRALDFAFVASALARSIRRIFSGSLASCDRPITRETAPISSWPILNFGVRFCPIPF
jgi:hypothetical protein